MSQQTPIAAHEELVAPLDREMLASLDGLTETQRRRILARMGGATLQEIANEEGCSASAVDQSLQSVGVQKVMTILGRNLTVYRRKDAASALEVIDPILEVLQSLLKIACSATRAIVVSDGAGITRIQLVHDYPTRLAAAARFLSLIDHPASVPLARGAAGVAPTVELEQEQTTSTRRRVRVSRP